MCEDTRPVSFEAPKELADQIAAYQVHAPQGTDAPTLSASPDVLGIIARYQLAAWIMELKADSPQHAGWISNLASAFLAYPGSLIPESYRWPFEMLEAITD